MGVDYWTPPHHSAYGDTEELAKGNLVAFCGSGMNAS